ncbi:MULTISPECIES: hypothetical protein [unclassified Butyrivibrio]|uniref:hypothetical protein n=1 Tax=unclassified Butyrivibrio TaxID=2639466 RepID=UPI0003B666B1|nr:MULTISPECIES: hypothetical protein [unclassified Butyrivibrio]SEK94652.1 hypothetical protein SAMN04487770_104124 [Butyrivibrio sp. ob235]
MSGISGIGFNSSYASGFFGPAFNSGTGTASEAAAGALQGETKVTLNPGESVEKKPGMRSSPAECETCKNRKYIDGSDENVSFKSAAHISPEAAPSRVRGHEQEHVANAYKKAAQGDGKVLQASVKIQTAVCPECGRTYVSGGLTTTQIMYKNEDNPYQKNRKSADAASGLIGSSFDAAV